MLNVPFFFFFFYSVSQPLDLCKANKSTGRQNSKEKTQKTEDVINSDLILGLKRDLANKTARTDKRREVENGFRQTRNTKSVAFFHMFHTHTHTDTCRSRVAHIAVKDKGSTVVFLCGSVMDRKEKREKKRG